MHRKRILLAVACAMMLFISVNALALSPSGSTSISSNVPQAVTNPDIVLEAELGYAGAVTYMRDIPLTVSIENTGADIAGSICVNLYRNNMYYDRYEYPISLASGSKKQVILPVNLKMKQERYVIEFVKDNQVIASVIKLPARTIQPESVLIGVLSPDPQSLSYMNQDTLATFLTDRYEAWQLVSLSFYTFPKTDSLMKSFMILVVDGFDVSLLPPESQQVLDNWIQNGGIVLVGGGAQAAIDYPYFAKYTGLVAGGVSETEDITPYLIEDFAFVGAKALGQKVLVNEVLASSNAPLSQGTYPLIYRHTAGSGLIYTTAFELGAKPLSSWSGIGGLWPRIIVSSAGILYQAQYSQMVSNTYEKYYNTYMLDNVPIETAGNTTPVIVLLSVYLVMVGLGSYLLLKKLDKRELMWFTVPALAVICMLGMHGLGELLAYNKPTVATFTSIRMNPQGERLISTIGSIATPDSGEALVKGVAGVSVIPIDSSSYYYDAPQDATAPKQQMFRMVIGDGQSVGYPAGSPWSRKLMTITGDANNIGSLTGRIWMEEDGLHAEIVNNTPYPFGEGFVITNLGYAKVGEIAPGGSAKAAILKPAQAEKKGEVNVAGAPASLYETKIKDGVMIASSVVRDYGNDLYPLIRAAIYPEEQTDEASAQAFRENMSNDERIRRNFMVDAMNQVASANTTGSENWLSAYHYIAFQNEIGQSKLYINGDEVQKHGHRAVVDVLLTFDPIGPTGIVSYPLGTLKAYPVQVGLDGSITVQKEKLSDPYMSYQLSQKPVFCFKLPDISKYTISDLSINTNTYDAVPVMQVYNHSTGDWDEKKTISVTLAESELPTYIDTEGQLFVRFVSGGSSTAQDYSSVMAPNMSLEGRVK